MTLKTTIVIADDHPVFRAGLRQIISADPNFTVLAEAGDGRAALEAISREKPSIALLDFDLPELNGLEIARAMQRASSPAQVVILTMHNVEALFNEALDAGVSGYLLKDNAVVDVLGCLRAVAAGGVYISPAMSSYLVRRTRNGSALLKAQPGLANLTPTERRVLSLIATNKTSKEIGRELFISYRTVETHRSNICEKLGLRGSNKLLQFAIEHRSEL